MAYTLKQKAELYHQLYVGSKAGLPTHALLDPAMLPAAFRNKHTANLPRLLEKGRPLSAALLYVKAIAPWESRLLATGEAAGKVEHVLADLESLFLARHQQVAALKAKLLYPLVVLVVGTLAGPTPRLASGELNFAEYVAAVGVKLAVIYALYRLLVVHPIERSTVGLMNPLVVKMAYRLGNDHWLRQLFEVNYLNMLVSCLESGLPADESLKLLRDGIDDIAVKQQHVSAISQIQKHGASLNQALTGGGILRNYQIVSFLNTAERSGTLHSDLRQYVARRRGELDALVRHKLTQLGRWLYFAILLLALVGYF